MCEEKCGRDGLDGKKKVGRRGEMVGKVKEEVMGEEQGKKGLGVWV